MIDNSFEYMSNYLAKIINKNFLQFDEIYEIDLIDGSKSYRVKHKKKNNHIYKGGLRIDANTDLETIKCLAVLMTLKSSFYNLPLSGAKGLIQANPNSDFKKEELISEYVYRLYNHNKIGEIIDVLAPDLGSTIEDMKYINSLNKKETLATGELEHKFKWVGYTSFKIFDKLIDSLNQTNLKTIAITGFFGQMGYDFTRRLVKNKNYNMKVTHILLRDQYIYSEQGFDLKELNQIKSNKKSLENLNLNLKIIDGAPKINTDVYISAARENLVNENNIENFEPKVFVELANMGISYDCVKAMDKKCLVFPDFIMNVGGVLTSYLELESKKNTNEKLIKLSINETINDNLDKFLEYRDKNMFYKNKAYKNKSLREYGIQFAYDNFLNYKK